jgi:hypothetical protein
VVDVGQRGLDVKTVKGKEEEASSVIISIYGTCFPVLSSSSLDVTARDEPKPRYRRFSGR